MIGLVIIFLKILSLILKKFLSMVKGLEILLNNFEYRSDIDGLRAIAVVPVILFHSGISLSLIHI